jgi:mxaJ protein
MRLLLSCLLALLAAHGARGERSPPTCCACAPTPTTCRTRTRTAAASRTASRAAGADLGLPLEYAWLPDRRGFVRKTMGAGLCDLIIGVPVGFERTLNTRPYYRSSYVLVQRAGDAGAAAPASTIRGCARGASACS